MADKHILVLGAGSVGKRHLRNFTKLGCKLSAMDPTPRRLDEAGTEVKLEGGYLSLDEILKVSSAFDGVVVASPPKYHVAQCVAMLEKNIPIFLEKPVSPNYAEARTLLDSLNRHPKARLLLGYTYRWWPPLREFRKMLASGVIGKMLHAQFVMSAHLADWHPGERYQDFFMASKDLGGGALLDESHFLDLMRWFFGNPEWLCAKVEKISDLEIETDDNVDMLAGYANGLRVTMHLDLYGRPHEKYILVEGEKGSLKWSFDPNCIQKSERMEQVWDTQTFTCERNDMFMLAAVEFLEILSGQSGMTCTLADGVEVLRIVEACRTSSGTDRFVRLSEIA